MTIPTRDACRQGCCETDLPQRHRITGNAASVEGRLFNIDSFRLFPKKFLVRVQLTADIYGDPSEGVNSVDLAWSLRQLGTTKLDRYRIRPLAATAPNHGKRCHCGNEPDDDANQRCLSTGLLRDGPAATALNHWKHCQCGNEPDDESQPEMPVDRAAARRTCRNGTESLETLPVWKGDYLTSILSDSFRRSSWLASGLRLIFMLLRKYWGTGAV